jgi:hypothetical protein
VLNLLWSLLVLFFCVNNILLNIISNNAPIYRDKYSILPKEVTEVLYDGLLRESLCFLYLSNEVLLYIIL